MAWRFPIFLVSFSVNVCVFLLSNLLRVLLTLSPCCLFIRLFCYALLVAIFYSRIVQFLLHPVVVGRIFFRCFWMFCFVCIALLFVDIFLIFRQYFWLISSSCIVIFSCVAFFFLSQHVSKFFLCFICFHSFFYLRFQSNFPSRFWYFVRVL